MKRIVILGSTGSIGQQTLEVVRAFPGQFQVVGLAAGKNVSLLHQQVQEFQPQFISLQSEGNHPAKWVEFLPKTDVVSPEEMATCPEVDLVIVATSGRAGLHPTLAAIKTGKRIALANKEVLVMAGEIVLSLAKGCGAEIFPIDSEHSAIWQCLQGEQKTQVSRLFLTASGGPFRHYSPERLARVTVAEALAHPTWQMGKKVTIDSATLMNKGMEIIEAHWLFDMPLELIEVVIHPESIVHSMVEFQDGSIKAQLSFPDMRLPIQYALFYPERCSNPQFPHLDFRNIQALHFSEPDRQSFPCLSLATDAAIKGGTYPAVLCAADEIAVELFLDKQVRFVDISQIIEKTLTQHQGISHPSLEEVLSADQWATVRAREIALQGSLR